MDTCLWGMIKQNRAQNKPKQSCPELNSVSVYANQGLGSPLPHFSRVTRKVISRLWTSPFWGQNLPPPFSWEEQIKESLQELSAWLANTVQQMSVHSICNRVKMQVKNHKETLKKENLCAELIVIIYKTVILTNCNRCKIRCRWGWHVLLIERGKSGECLPRC